MWQDISTAPTDGTEILVYAPAAHGLKAMQSVCAYHPDAGFCIDELREPTHWQPLQPPPSPVTDATAIISNAIGNNPSIGEEPNAETIAAMEEARNGGLPAFNSVADLMADLSDGEPRPNDKLKAMYANYLDVKDAKAALADYEANGGVTLDELKASIEAPLIGNMYRVDESRRARPDSDDELGAPYLGPEND